MRKTLLPLCAIPFTLAACNQTSEPLVGGPCAYETLTEEAYYALTDEDLVTLKAETRDYVIESRFFDTPPQKGDRYKVTSDHITKGTCTPVITTKVEKL